jgi:hypothetical protein
MATESKEKNGNGSVLDRLAAILAVVVLLGVWVNLDKNNYEKDMKLIDDRLTKLENHTSDGHPGMVIAMVKNLENDLHKHENKDAHTVAQAEHEKFKQWFAEVETQFREERGLRYAADAAIREVLKLPKHEYLPKSKDMHMNGD